MSTIHFYQCPNCRSSLLSPIKASYGTPYRCPLCARYMRWIWKEDVPGRLERVVHEPTPSVMEALRHPETGATVAQFFDRR
jgi:hypothetical protein